jgi:hypothetical protein
VCVCVCVCVCNRLRIAADCVQQLQHHCLLVEGRVGGLEDAQEDRGEEHAQLALKVRLEDQQQRNEYLHQHTSACVEDAQLALKVRLKDQQQRNEYLHHVSIRQHTSAYVSIRQDA